MIQLGILGEIVSLVRQVRGEVFLDGESEISANEAPCERGDDRACGSREDDVDVGDDAGVGEEGVGAVYPV